MILTKISNKYKKLYAQNRNNIFQKKNSKYEILNHLYFGSNFAFGDCFRAFWSVFFFYSLLSANHGGLNLYSAPHHKKASYGPVMANF